MLVQHFVCIMYIIIYFFKASWVGKLMECIDNRIKQARKKRIATGDCYAPTPKKKRSTAPKDDLLRRCMCEIIMPKNLIALYVLI